MICKVNEFYNYLLNGYYVVITDNNISNHKKYELSNGKKTMSVRKDLVQRQIKLKKFFLIRTSGQISNLHKYYFS